MQGEEFKKFAADIKARGLTDPIVLYQDKILDSCNRYRACHQTGIEPRFEQFPGDDKDALAFVISKNIHRRNLTPETKRYLLAKLIAQDPQKSNRQIAKSAGVSHPHVAKVRAEMEKSGDVETVSTSVDTMGRQQPAKKHRCWHCGARAQTGEVKEHRYPESYGDDVDVWLHDSCVAAFEKKANAALAARDDDDDEQEPAKKKRQPSEKRLAKAQARSSFTAASRDAIDQLEALDPVDEFADYDKEVPPGIEADTQRYKDHAQHWKQAGERLAALREFAAFTIRNVKSGDLKVSGSPALMAEWKALKERVEELATPDSNGKASSVTAGGAA